MTDPDNVMAEVYRVRDALAAEACHDVGRLFAICERSSLAAPSAPDGSKVSSASSSGDTTAARKVG